MSNINFVYTKMMAVFKYKQYREGEKNPQIAGETVLTLPNLPIQSLKAQLRRSTIVVMYGGAGCK